MVLQEDEDEIQRKKVEEYIEEDREEEEVKVGGEESKEACSLSVMELPTFPSVEVPTTRLNQLIG